MDVACCNIIEMFCLIDMHIEYRTICHMFCLVENFSVCIYFWNISKHFHGYCSTRMLTEHTLAFCKNLPLIAGTLSQWNLQLIKPIGLSANFKKYIDIKGGGGGGVNQITTIIYKNVACFSWKMLCSLYLEHLKGWSISYFKGLIVFMGCTVTCSCLVF